jgi:hypothetical protein
MIQYLLVIHHGGAVKDLAPADWTPPRGGPGAPQSRAGGRSRPARSRPDEPERIQATVPAAAQPDLPPDGTSA